VSDFDSPDGRTYSDPRAETDHARWLDWMEARTYSTHPDDCEGMAEAFAAGMQAARMLAPEPELRYALVEQMGFRRTYGTIRETEFLGKPVLEVTSLETGAVSLAAPESLYALTWLTRQQAEQATRTGSHSPAALSAAIAEDLASWGADDEYGSLPVETLREMRENGDEAASEALADIEAAQ
jgi:hypothetical protein